MYIIICYKNLTGQIFSPQLKKNPIRFSIFYNFFICESNHLVWSKRSRLDIHTSSKNFSTHLTSSSGEESQTTTHMSSFRMHIT